jgi:phage host-nuclease inhibitor protein Gam
MSAESGSTQGRIFQTKTNPPHLCVASTKGSMNNRIKLKTPALKTRAEMELLMREIAGLKLNETLLAANMDSELQGVRDSYEGRLASLAQVLEEKTAAAREWAEANPAEFGQRKSIEFTHGIAGFRTGTPKLKTVSKCKWDSVLQTLRDLAWGHAYIRVKEEINKEQILADVAAQILNEADLRKAGAQVVQEESFFVEPKLTRVDAREVA